MIRYSLYMTDGAESWAATDSDDLEAIQTHSKWLREQKLADHVRVVGIYDGIHALWVEEYGPRMPRS